MGTFGVFLISLGSHFLRFLDGIALKVYGNDCASFVRVVTCMREKFGAVFNQFNVYPLLMVADERKQSLPHRTILFWTNVLCMLNTSREVGLSVLIRDLPTHNTVY